MVVLAGFVLGLTLLIQGVAHTVFQSRSHALEFDLMRGWVGRGVHAIAQETEELRREARRWAVSDDTRAFMQSHDPALLAAALADAHLAGQELSLVGFVDEAGRALHAKAYDYRRQHALAVPASLWSQVLATTALANPDPASQAVAGLLLVEDSVWQVAAAPVVAREPAAGRQGACILARRFDGRNLAPLAGGDEVSYRVLAGHRIAPADCLEPVRGTRLTLWGHTHIKDLDGRARIVLTAEMPRRILAHDRGSLLWLSGAVLACGATVGLAALALADRWVLHPLADSLRTLKAGIGAVTPEGAMRVQAGARRANEVGDLAESINAMLRLLDESRLALRASEELHRSLFESAPDAIVSLDHTGRILSANTAFRRQFAPGRADAPVGERLPDVWPGPVVDAILPRLAALPASGAVTLDDACVLQAQGERWFSVSLARVGSTPAAGGAGHCLAVLREVTARVRSEREAELHRQQLFQAQRLAALGTLVAGVAHEVNNPNNVIRLNADVLLRRLERQAVESTGTDDAVAMLREMRDASGRIAAIVAALKEFARPSRDRMDEALDVNLVVQDAANLMRHAVGKARCVLRLELADHLPAIRGKPQQLAQVIVNLLQNACRAATRPDMPITITSAADAAGGNVLVTVADEGRGIAAADLERVFDPFFTTHREAGGMGLGLAISAAIMHAHGGCMRVTSVEGQGTRMTLVLPVAGGSVARG